jgi:hypothetical protein
MLDRWGADTWAKLHDWQLENFPFLVAQRRGLGDSLVNAMAARGLLDANDSKVDA